MCVCARAQKLCFVCVCEWERERERERERENVFIHICANVYVSIYVYVFARVYVCSIYVKDCRKTQNDGRSIKEDGSVQQLNPPSRLKSFFASTRKKTKQKKIAKYFFPRQERRDIQKWWRQILRWQSLGKF